MDVEAEVKEVQMQRETGGCQLKEEKQDRTHDGLSDGATGVRNKRADLFKDQSSAVRHVLL